MRDGEVEGFLVMGENPAVGSANGRLAAPGDGAAEVAGGARHARDRDRDLLARSPEVETGELRAEDMGTEVFLMPAAAHTEKSGSFTNTHRLLQWHTRLSSRPATRGRSCGSCTSSAGASARSCAGSADPKDRAILDLTWDYPTEGPSGEPDAEAVLREISGWGPDGRALTDYTGLRNDGSTVSGAGSTAARTPTRSTRPRGGGPAPSRAGSPPSGAGPGR